MVPAVSEDRAEHLHCLFELVEDEHAPGLTGRYTNLNSELDAQPPETMYGRAVPPKIEPALAAEGGRPVRARAQQRACEVDRRLQGAA